MAGRPSKIENAEFAKAVAMAYIDGHSHTTMAETFGVNNDTVSRWCRDPRVQAHASGFAQERVNRITRKIDSAMESRLNRVDDLDTEVLLKIRKEYLDRALKISLGAEATAETTNEVMDELEKNPEMAKELTELLAAKK